MNGTFLRSKKVSLKAALTLAPSSLLASAAALVASELTAGTPSAQVPEWAIDDGAHQAAPATVELQGAFLLGSSAPVPL